MKTSALLIAFALAAPAAAVNQDPPVAKEDAVTMLALTAVDTRMTVPVQISGAGPYRFVIDTGAQRTVISQELAKTLGLLPGRDVRLTAMTGTSRVGTAIIPSLTVSSFGGNRIEAPALAERHLGARGMLGIDTLQGHAVSIDFDTDTMAVRVSKKRSGGGLGPLAPNEIVVKAKSVFGQLVVTDAHYRGRRIRVVLDTGSPVSVGNEALRKIVAKRNKINPIVLTSVVGDQLSANYTQIDTVEMGGAVFHNLPVAFADAAPFKQFGIDDKPALLLGMDALALFRRVDIDFANRELRLTRPRG